MARAFCFGPVRSRTILPPPSRLFSSKGGDTLIAVFPPLPLYLTSVFFRRFFAIAQFLGLTPGDFFESALESMTPGSLPGERGNFFVCCYLLLRMCGLSPRSDRTTSRRIPGIPKSCVLSPFWSAMSWYDPFLLSNGVFLFLVLYMTCFGKTTACVPVEE